MESCYSTLITFDRRCAREVYNINVPCMPWVPQYAAILKLHSLIVHQFSLVYNTNRSGARYPHDGS